MIEITLVSLSGILKYSVFVEGYRFLSQTADSKLEVVYQVAFGINIFLCCMYILPLGMLTYVQIANLFIGLTTYERYANRNRNQNKSSSFKASTVS